MHSRVIHNGQVCPVEPTLTPGQYGLLSGWGVFSTLRIYDGVPFAYEWHWERMIEDAARLRIRMDFDREEIRLRLLELIELNGAQNGGARMYFVRNKGGIWSLPPARETDYLLSTADLNPWPASSRLTVTPQGRHAAAPLAGVKVLSWITNVTTLEEAQSRGFDETVLLNERGEVSECTAANIFIVHGGRLMTPSLATGCLRGVTRRTVFAAASRAGINIEETAFTLDELRAADEVFISSTTREIMPVREVDGTMFAVPGPWTERVHALYRGFVREYLENTLGARARQR